MFQVSYLRVLFLDSMSGAEPYECLRCGWAHQHVPAHGPECRCATTCPHCGGVSMRRDDADNMITPLKRMLECAERQQPSKPFSMKDFMELMYRIKQQRDER